MNEASVTNRPVRPQSIDDVRFQILTERARVHVTNGRHVGWMLFSNFDHVSTRHVRAGRTAYRADPEKVAA